jgi:hypothetical protein
MKIYQCDLCDFSTFKLFDFNRHLKTKTHLKKTGEFEKIYSCDLCGKQFTQRQGLYKHKKNSVCRKEIHKQNLDEDDPFKINNSDIKKLIELLSENAKQQKEEILKREKQEELLKEEILKREKLMYEAISKLADRPITTSNTLNYNTFNIRQTKNTYLDAPHLVSFTKEEMEQIQHTPELELVDCVAYHQEHKTLDKYIGDLIVKRYKKDDPSQQSLWNSDVARFHYIVMQEVSANKKNWVNDKAGIVVVSKTIRPVLKYIRKEIVNYFRKGNYGNDDQLELNINKYLTDPEICSRLNTVVSDIDHGLLEHRILKYITPFFVPVPPRISYVRVSKEIDNDDNDDDDD